MFSQLVPEYDRFNRISSMGLDVHWRREAVSLFQPGSLILDVGTGTGDVAREVVRQGSRVVGIDFSESMIQAARKKMESFPEARFEVAEAHRIPEEAASFDGLASAFVIRNLHHGNILIPSLREFARVLKPGSQMVHLELTQPPKGWLLWGHRVYMKTILPSVGKVLFGKRWPSSYLRNTIQTFPSPRTLCQWIRWSGFKNVCHYPLHGGIASLFVAVRN